MLIVFSVAQRELDRALDMLAWMGQLGSYKNHNMVILTSSQVSIEDTRNLAGFALELFGRVEAIHQREVNEEPWPANANAMFRTAVNYLTNKGNNEPFLWFEMDMIPILGGWLDAIEAEYRQVQKQFLGAFYDKPCPHINGGMVYPPDVARVNPAMVNATQKPFDLTRPDIVLQKAYRSSLIVRSLANPAGNVSHTFPDEASLSSIPSPCVLFHGCKDGTLIARLRERGNYKSTLRPETCVICLGRYGDIMGALPIAQHLSENGKAPVSFMVAQEFADILTGVSYVVPHVYAGKYNEMPAATAIAQQNYANVVRAQIYGTPEACPESGLPHNRVAWKLAGFEKEWLANSFPLTFDVRDKGRERALLKRYVERDERPVLLLNLTGGHSGPFHDGAETYKRFVEDLKGLFQIVNLSDIRATHIYDLLGFMEIAAAMVTIDTATVHLAKACMRLPVLMLQPDRPYYAAHPKCNYELIVRYSEWRDRYAEMTNWIVGKGKKPEVIHVYETHADLSERTRRAQSTWSTMWNGCGWRKLPFSEPYPRSSRDIGDPRGVPFITDVLRFALNRAKDDMSVIVFTNDDIILLPGCHNEIMRIMARVPAMSASRRDIKTFDEVSNQTPLPTHQHCGRDLFAFRAWWLREFLPEIPPLLLGSNDWDNCLGNLIRRECGTLIPGLWSWESSYTVTDDQLASINILHEMHDPFADSAEHKKGPHNRWNWVQIALWQRKHLPALKFPWTDFWYEGWLRGEVTFKPSRQTSTASTMARCMTVIR